MNDKILAREESGRIAEVRADDTSSTEQYTQICDEIRKLVPVFYQMLVAADFPTQKNYMHFVVLDDGARKLAAWELGEYDFYDGKFDGWSVYVSADGELIFYRDETYPGDCLDSQHLGKLISLWKVLESARIPAGGDERILRLWKENQVSGTLKGLKAQMDALR